MISAARMAFTAHLLASGPGWSARDIVCTAGPHDRPFEERHDTVCIAVVMEGTFQYRSAQGAAVLMPGAMLLGNHGTCYECGHEHGTGDRCLSFSFTPDHLESVIAGGPGTRQMTFSLPRLPPLQRFLPLVAEAEAACDDGDGMALEELALRLAGAVTATLADRRQAAHAPSSRDERRITRVLRWIEINTHERITLAGLASEAAMSPYHFLRTFCAVAGMTPYQFVLGTRLHRTAVRLRRSDESISAIAFEMGFGDLSTFNRRFRRVMGVSPSVYRAQFRRNAPG